MERKKHSEKWYRGFYLYQHIMIFLPSHLPHLIDAHSHASTVHFYGSLNLSIFYCFDFTRLKTTFWISFRWKIIQDWNCFCIRRMDWVRTVPTGRFHWGNIMPGNMRQAGLRDKWDLLFWLALVWQFLEDRHLPLLRIYGVIWVGIQRSYLCWTSRQLDLI